LARLFAMVSTKTCMARIPLADVDKASL